MLLDHPLFHLRTLVTYSYWSYKEKIYVELKQSGFLEENGIMVLASSQFDIP